MAKPINYSKWDKLELSDDEDFECHPNVDKASMVRWRQSDLHRKRRDRRDKIEALKLETAFNASVVLLIQDVITALRRGEPIDSAVHETMSKVVELDAKLKNDVMVLAHTDRDPRWPPPTPDPFFMSRLNIDDFAKAVNSLVADAGEAGAGAKILKIFVDAETSMKERQTKLANEIKKVEEEISSKITTETIKEGFSKTVLTGKEESIKKESSYITIHDPKDKLLEPAGVPASAEKLESGVEDDKDAYITDKAAEAFSKISSFEESYKFLGAHPHIVNQKYSDEILAQAFNMEMEGHSKESRQCVHQSLILQYCHVLGKDGVMLFFSRAANPSHSAKEIFIKDVTATYQRIHDRVKELKKQEADKEAEEKRQGLERVKAALQPDGSYALPLTEESSEEDKARAAVFAEFPPSFQRAILLQDVDEINQVLETLEKGAAEEMLKKADTVGLITLQGDDTEVDDQ